MLFGHGRQAGILAVTGDAAFLAIAPLAVGHRGAVLDQHLLVFVLEEALVRARMDVVPGEYLVEGPLAVHAILRIAMLRPQRLPTVIAEMLSEGLEDHAALIGRIDK